MLLELYDLSANGGPTRRCRACYLRPEVLELVLGPASIDRVQQEWTWRRGPRVVRCQYGLRDYGPAESIAPAAVTRVMLDWLREGEVAP